MIELCQYLCALYELNVELQSYQNCTLTIELRARDYSKLTAHAMKVIAPAQKMNRATIFFVFPLLSLNSITHGLDFVKLGGFCVIFTILYFFKKCINMRIFC